MAEIEHRVPFDVFLDERRKWLGFATWKEVSRRTRLKEDTIQKIRETGSRTDARPSTLHTLAMALEADDWDWLLQAHRENNPRKIPAISTPQLARLASRLQVIAHSPEQIRTLMSHLDDRTAGLLARAVIDRLAGEAAIQPRSPRAPDVRPPGPRST